MEEEKSHTTTKQNKNNKKTDLLKYERPVFELKRNQEGKVESIIQKLMAQQK